MEFSWIRHQLQFKTSGGTSRGVLRHKDSWLIQISKDDQYGIGECSIIEGLSPGENEIMEHPFSPTRKARCVALCLDLCLTYSRAPSTAARVRVN